MVRNTLEHRAQDQDEYADERAEAKEKALMGFLVKLDEKNPELVQDLIQAGGHRTDKSQMSWVKDNGISDSIKTFHTMRDAMVDMSPDDRRHVAESAAEAIMKPATEHTNQNNAWQKESTDGVRDTIAHAIENSDFAEYHRAYRMMTEIQTLNYGDIARDNAQFQSDMSGNGGRVSEEDYRRIMEQQEDPEDRVETRAMHWETLEGLVDGVDERAEAMEKPDLSYSEMPPDMSKHERAYISAAVGELGILSKQPASIGTFLKSMMGKVTGSTNFENGYDLSDSDRREAAENLVENLKDIHPKLVETIAQRTFPQGEWERYPTDFRQLQTENNEALYAALEATVEDIDRSERNLAHRDSVREHLRHTVTEFMTHPTDAIIKEIKDHRGLDPSSDLGHKIDEKLTKEIERLQYAQVDIYKSDIERDSRSEMWKQIRHDIQAKENEAKDTLKEYHDRQRQEPLRMIRG